MFVSDPLGWNKELEKGVKKRFIPPSQIMTFPFSAPYDFVIQKGRKTFFPNNSSGPDCFCLADSSGIPYDIEDQLNWVLSEFVKKLNQPPSTEAENGHHVSRSHFSFTAPVSWSRLRFLFMVHVRISRTWLAFLVHVSRPPHPFLGRGQTFHVHVHVGFTFRMFQRASYYS